MDYVDWVESVMLSVAGVWSEASERTKLTGLGFVTIADAVVSDCQIDVSKIKGQALQQAIRSAAKDLEGIGLLDCNRNHFWKLTSEGGKFPAARLSTEWPQIMDMHIDDEERAFLEAVAKTGQELFSGFVGIKEVTGQLIGMELGWEWSSGSKDKCLRIAKQLGGRGMLTERAYLGGHIDISPTYLGIVRVTRQVESDFGKLVRVCVSEWETTNVDFKRELNLSSNKEKAEFIRDVLGLATTKSTGRRLLIVGFDDRTRGFHTSVEATITQERLEQILHAYSEPVPDIRYNRVPWQGGEIGVVEMLREPAKIPYSVKKSLGGKSGIGVGDVYVRHGSHTEQPTPKELLDLKEEGSRARRVAIEL